MRRRMSRFLAVCAAGTVLAFATPASAADLTIHINDGNVPTTAAAYKQGCDFGGGPFVGFDVWVFNLPGNHNTTGDFKTVTATFSTPGGEVTKTIPTDGGEIVLDSGTSKAWIKLPAGWTLTDASAVISGTANDFVLTHTCKAGSYTPSPSPSPSVSVTPSPSVTPSASGTPSPGVSGSSVPSGSVAPSTSPAPTLPLTGAAVGGMVTAAVLFIAAGATLLVLQRRRKMSDLSDAA